MTNTNIPYGSASGRAGQSVSLLQEPGILKETYQGVSAFRITDDMFQRREITCTGEIDADSVNSLISQILYLAHTDPEGEITMYINSPGGEVSSGLALYDVMQAVKCPVRTICVGMAASMAAVLFAAGRTREILPHARVMIHDPLISGGAGGSALQLKSLSDDLMRTREILCDILAQHTGRTPEEIYDKTRTDTYFYAEEAVEFGLADRIIREI